MVDLDRAFGVVVLRAEEHRETITMGRTHGVHAELAEVVDGGPEGVGQQRQGQA